MVRTGRFDFHSRSSPLSGAICMDVQPWQTDPLCGTGVSAHTHPGFDRRIILPGLSPPRGGLTQSQHLAVEYHFRASVHGASFSEPGSGCKLCSHGFGIFFDGGIPGLYHPCGMGSLELALGVHTANNLFALLLANTSISSLPSPSIFTVNVLDPLYSVLAGLVAWMVFVWLIFGPLRRRQNYSPVSVNPRAAAGRGSLGGRLFRPRWKVEFLRTVGRIIDHSSVGEMFGESGISLLAHNSPQK